MFLVVDGVDGAGKTSLLNSLFPIMKQLASPFNVIRTREPGGCDLSEGLREFIFHNKMDVATETLLMFAARTEHMKRTILPALDNNSWVVCDRFNSSTYAYQVAQKAFDEHLFFELERMTLSLLPPSTRLTTMFEVILDVNYDESCKRTSGRKDNNRFDDVSKNEFIMRRQAYHNRALQNPTSRVIVDTTSKTPAQVLDEVVAHVQAHLKVSSLQFI